MTTPVIIAHRGASGYLPEHTREAKVLAHGMGADFLEQDVISTRDSVPIVLHDIDLAAVTDVALRFVDRKRSDGNFYAIDFDYAEIQQLRVFERFQNRYPHRQGLFRISSLDDEIELIKGLNRSTGRDVGIYPEIKSPDWHTQNNIDLTHMVLATLDNHGYNHRRGNVFLQSFDAPSLRRVRDQYQSRIPVVQLLDNSSDISATALDVIAGYANGIGPPLSALVNVSADGIAPSGLCELAHERNLQVHPYTFRADQLPDFAKRFEELVRFFIHDVGVDGIFTDFPDIAVAVRNQIAID